MCGFVGIIGVDEAAPLLHVGLSALQHRGQDAAGIATFDFDSPHIYKGTGLVSQVFSDPRTLDLPGSVGIGHNRYPTWGGRTVEEAQPFLNRYPTLLMAHNGNMLDVPGWDGTGSDSEALLVYLSRQMVEKGGMHPSHFAPLMGSFSLCMATPEMLIGVRDPGGIRPLVYGRKGRSWMIASETVALEVLGYTDIQHLGCGQMVELEPGQEPRVHTWRQQPQPRHCVFERIYLARPDSVMEEGRGISTRGRLGVQLAQEWGVEADVVVAVPDTSRPAAMALAERLGLPLREGLIKNRYSGRTFIMPDQATRNAALRLKLNPIREVFEGQRVILVDDSIVRGSTMKSLVDLVWSCGPTEIHVASMSPPVQHPCHLGINMSTYHELIAVGKTEEQLAKELKATSVKYLSVKGLYEVMGEGICAQCFDGKSPLVG